MGARMLSSSKQLHAEVTKVDVEVKRGLEHVDGKLEKLEIMMERILSNAESPRRVGGGGGFRFPTPRRGTRSASPEPASQ